MYSMFEANETEVILLVDAENTFNSINGKVLLHLNIPLQLLSYISARLFIIGGRELRSQEGTPQGDQTAIAL